MKVYFCEMENCEVTISIEHLSILLKDKSLDKESIRSILQNLVEKHNLSRPTIYETTINDMLDKLFKESKIENLSEFEKLLQKATHFNPKKK